MTPGMLCALTCTSYRLHACTGVPRTFVWSLWACRERPVSRSAVGRAGGGNQARDTGRRRSGADPASAQHLHLVAWRGTELSAVVGHMEQQRRRLVGAQVGWSATDAAISSSTATRGQEVVITVVSCDDYMVDWRASFVGGVPTDTGARHPPTDKAVGCPQAPRRRSPRHASLPLGI